MRYDRSSVALASQRPRVLNDTLKRNVTAFTDGPVDAARYAAALAACQLDADVSRLPAGDRTEIGERGVYSRAGTNLHVAF